MARSAKPDPYLATTDLVANAIASARVLGESPRITRLVASSVGRFAAEMDREAGEALVRQALDQIGPEFQASVPELFARLKRLLEGAG